MSQSRRLTVVLLLNVILVVGLTVVGLLAGSVSLLAAAGDSIGDAFALGLGLLAVRLRDRHGRASAINIAALINVVVLLVVTGTVLWEAVARLHAGSPPVIGLAVLIAAVVTAAVLAAGMVVLGRGAADEDLHMRSVALDVAADGAAAAGTAIAGLVMAIVHGAYWLDPVVAALIAIAVAVGAVRLLVDVVRALRRGEAVEPDLD